MKESVKKFLVLLNQIDEAEAEFKKIVDEVSLREYRVLSFVAQSKPILKDVAGTRRVAAQGVGRLVERLRARGLLQVDKHQRDKRAKMVTLTVTGQAIKRRCDAAVARVLAVN